jgi:hypothetical protein
VAAAKAIGTVKKVKVFLAFVSFCARVMVMKWRMLSGILAAPRIME